MNKAFKMILVCLLCLIGIVLLYLLFILIYPTLTEYKPDQKIILKDTPGKGETLFSAETFTIMTWNIGYAGLGKEMDFFYEGGKRVRPTKEENRKYLTGISEFIKSKNSIDFLLLQEIDFKSRRSYKENQFSHLKEQLHNRDAVAARNYKSSFVPSPILDPMGSVDGGQATLSYPEISRAVRLATPGTYSWPLKLYMLKRCFLVSEYMLDNGKSLIIYNIHNSAFDDASDLREQELQLLKTLIEEDYKRGDYIVVGGDWNQNPPGWNIPKTSGYKLKELWTIPENYAPKGWHWGFDPALPTNRDVHEPFQVETTTCTLLDYYLVSPNISIQQVKTVDLKFENADHLPVIMTFKLKDQE